MLLWPDVLQIVKSCLCRALLIHLFVRLWQLPGRFARFYLGHVENNVAHLADLNPRCDRRLPNIHGDLTRVW